MTDPVRPQPPHTVEVWHNTQPTFTDDPPEFPGAFVYVAALYLTTPTGSYADLELAFRWTQHIGAEPWNAAATELPFTWGHYAYAAPRARSTSVGDLIRDTAGILWIVSPLGFRQLSPYAPMQTPHHPV